MDIGEKVKKRNQIWVIEEYTPKNGWLPISMNRTCWTKQDAVYLKKDLNTVAVGYCNGKYLNARLRVVKYGSMQQKSVKL